MTGAFHAWAIQRGWTRDPNPRPSGKSQVGIAFLRFSVTAPPREAIGPLVSNCFPRAVRTALCEKRCQESLTEISRSAHDMYARFTVNPLMSTVANCEDPNETLHYAY